MDEMDTMKHRPFSKMQSPATAAAKDMLSASREDKPAEMPEMVVEGAEKTPEMDMAVMGQEMASMAKEMQDGVDPERKSEIGKKMCELGEALMGEQPEETEGDA
jgi:hypothetical protein